MVGMELFAARVWHAWIAFPLFAGAIGIVLFVILGYVYKVVWPKYERR